MDSLTMFRCGFPEYSGRWQSDPLDHGCASSPVLEAIKGMVPDSAHAHGCPFHPRCLQAGPEYWNDPRGSRPNPDTGCEVLYGEGATRVDKRRLDFRTTRAGGEKKSAGERILMLWGPRTFPSRRGSLEDRGLCQSGGRPGLRIVEGKPRPGGQSGCGKIDGQVAPFCKGRTYIR